MWPASHARQPLTLSQDAPRLPRVFFPSSSPSPLLFVRNPSPPSFPLYKPLHEPDLILPEIYEVPPLNCLSDQGWEAWVLGP